MFHMLDEELSLQDFDSKITPRSLGGLEGSMSEGTVAPPGPLTNFFEQCSISFKELYLALVEYGSISLSKFSDQYGKFGLWGCDSRIDRTGRGSLDDMLRENEEIKSLILEILENLQEDLEYCTSLVRKASVRYSRQKDSEDGDGKDSWPSAENLSLESVSDSNSDGDEDRTQSHRDQHILQLIAHIVDHIQTLFETSAILRRPTISGKYIRSFSKTQKVDYSQLLQAELGHIDEKLRHWAWNISHPDNAESSKDDDMDMDFKCEDSQTLEQEDAPASHDEEMHEDVIPGSDTEANPPFNVPIYLRLRLAAANMRRRDQLKFWGKNPDLTPSIKYPAEHTKSAAPPSSQNIEESATRGPKNMETSTTKTQFSRSTVSSFSTMVLSDVMDTANLSKSPKTQYEPSVQGKEYVLRVPEPPISEGASSFACPYCSISLEADPMRDRELWKGHVYRDLRPYVCTFEDCQDPEKLYVTRREWIYHERQAHRRKWTCSRCFEDFESKKLLLEHFKTEHPKIFSISQLSVLTDICEQPRAENSVTDCPLCPITLPLSELKVHLATHMEELALFILPNDIPEEETPSQLNKVTDIEPESVDTWMARDQDKESSVGSLATWPTPAADRDLPNMREPRPHTRERRETKATTSRMSTFFVPGADIDREVISTDICRYLGNDALVRPGEFKRPNSRNEMIQGYFVTAYRVLTTNQLAALKADSLRWQSETQRNQSSRPNIGETYHGSLTYRVREQWGAEPSAEYSGQGGNSSADSPATSPTPAADSGLPNMRVRRELRPETQERREMKATTSHMLTFFVPGIDIDREVISTDISYYLGDDALVRPGEYKRPNSKNEMIQGYFITAYQMLTTHQLATLKADSLRWQSERQRNQSSISITGETYRRSLTHHDREEWSVRTSAKYPIQGQGQSNVPPRRSNQSLSTSDYQFQGAQQLTSAGYPRNPEYPAEPSSYGHDRTGKMGPPGVQAEGFGRVSIGNYEVAGSRNPDQRFQQGPTYESQEPSTGRDAAPNPAYPGASTPNPAYPGASTYPQYTDADGMSAPSGGGRQTQPPGVSYDSYPTQQLPRVTFHVSSQMGDQVGPDEGFTLNEDEYEDESMEEDQPRFEPQPQRDVPRSQRRETSPPNQSSHHRFLRDPVYGSSQMRDQIGSDEGFTFNEDEYEDEFMEEGQPRFEPQPQRDVPRSQRRETPPPNKSSHHRFLRDPIYDSSQMGDQVGSNEGFTLNEDEYEDEFMEEDQPRFEPRPQRDVSRSQQRETPPANKRSHHSERERRRR